MTQYFGVDWLAMCLTFSAIYLLGNKSRYGFAVMMLGNLCWAAIGVWAQSYAMLLANVGFFAMNVRGFAKWSPSEGRVSEPPGSTSGRERPAPRET